jgi:hypothetical protein
MQGTAQAWQEQRVFQRRLRAIMDVPQGYQFPSIATFFTRVQAYICSQGPTPVRQPANCAKLT